VVNIPHFQNFAKIRTQLIE